MEKPQNPRADAIIGTTFPCLDHGFIRLVDYMGNDEAIVQAARVSYGAGTKTTSEDKGLLRYMLRHGHSSPFEMVELKLHAKVPIFVARQWIRYRTANVNEVSMRYSLPPKESYVPELEDVRAQSLTNKQGRSDEGLDPRIQNDVRNAIADHNERSSELYKVFQGEDIARELARTVKPVGTYTEWYWKNDLRNVFHFLNQRLDTHAQKEIRVYAEAMSEIVKNVVPTAYEAFEDYILNAVTFSGPEMNALEKILTRKADPEEAGQKQGLKGRELREFLAKLPK